ncbi:glutaredoxin 3 [Methylotenera sp.]|uniref:glutaredoxin 3 n=1 Tax=Methylotenera sp. TaxID=2051956 RepID=UPI0027340709|nr:glutaredoxin 3 [Methylotenera sp.]MDP3004672.1 glutaredoxin 3 [Methylotenera sp.]MDP3330813.1 glutaredoxin 3 [Methylococcaceae bacterium]
MNNIVMYATATCPYCHAAERLLHSRDISDITFIRVDLDFDKRKEMIDRTGRRTVPQIYINDHHVGGFDDLQALDHSGELNHLLNAKRINLD